ncbi:DUF1516 family protein [Bacillus sp. JCM 19041]|uniref:DUF1516 family protein n=1 Tax=Bacillus sp. JCM 19041 TaxID=1460637 RepID=UPI0006CF35E2
MYDFLYQVHIGTWALLLIFIVLNVCFKKFFLNVIFRIISVVMLGSGIGLAFYLSFPLVFLVKLFIAILLIGTAEMMLKKENPRKAIVHQILIGVMFLILCLIGFGVIRF